MRGEGGVLCVTNYLGGEIRDLRVVAVCCCSSCLCGGGGGGVAIWGLGRVVS